jgi:hypothetical protein
VLATDSGGATHLAEDTVPVLAPAPLTDAVADRDVGPDHAVEQQQQQQQQQ